jgi:hypothetical protein
LPLHVSMSFKNHPQVARWLYFAKLLRWDLLMYVRYKIVRFVAVCHFNSPMCVSGVPYWVKSCHGIITKFHSERNTTHTQRQTEWNDTRWQIAQLYNERISTDPLLVTWQITVYEPPEDGFKKRPKHVGASVKCLM